MLFVMLQFWVDADAGDLRFLWPSLTRAFWNGAAVAVLVYSIVLAIIGPKTQTKRAA
ncbi:MAG TPA: hypothetical protein VGE54_06445 [Brevundimonas sp.]